MRRFKRIYIVAGLALVAALALPTASWATHPGHVFEMTVAPKGKLKDKPVPAALNLVLGGADDPATPNDPAPPKAQTIAAQMDKDVKMSTKGFKPCTANLDGTTTDQAKAACPKSIAGTGAVTAAIGAATVAGNVVVFIGQNNSMIAHVRVDALAATQIINVPIQTAPDQSLYRQQLFIQVPSLAGGAGSLTSLDFTFDKKAKKKKKSGKKKIYNLVTVKCTDGVWNFLNDETYSDHEAIHEPFTQTCSK
jgi:hypothetical protein